LLTVPLKILDVLDVTGNKHGWKQAGEGEQKTLCTLLDTGADENFIDVAVARRMGMLTGVHWVHSQDDVVAVEMANGLRTASNPKGR